MRVRVLSISTSRSNRIFILFFLGSFPFWREGEATSFSIFELSELVLAFDLFGQVKPLLIGLKKVYLGRNLIGLT